MKSVFKEEYNNLMQGGLGIFTYEELCRLIFSFKDINTLSIQKSNDGLYYAKVDENTVKEYNKSK